MACRIRTGDSHGFNKGRSSKFRVGSRVRQTPEEGRRTYRPKRCGVTLRPHPHTHSSSSRTFSSWPAGDQLVAEGVTHISLPLHKNTIGGTGENKTDEQTRTKLGVNQEQKEVLQHFISVCGLALAWVTSENSTSTGMPTSFDSIFFAVAGPSLLCYCLRSPVLTAPVRGSTPTLCCPVATSLVRVPSSTLFRVPLPLPDTARFQVQKSFVWFRAETDKGIVCSGHPFSATVEITIKLKTIVRNPLMIKIIKLRLWNLDN